MWNKNRRGSNLVYIIILMAILGILAAAYSAVSIYSARSAAEQRRHEQDYITAVSLRDTFVDMAESMTWSGYPKNATDALGEIDIIKFFGASVSEYQDYVNEMMAYEGLSDEEKAETSSPVFESSSESLTSTAALPEGTLKQTHTVNITQKEEKKPICWLEIEIEFTSKETGKLYKLAARLEPEPKFTFDSPWIEGWKAVRYYEAE